MTEAKKELSPQQKQMQAIVKRGFISIVLAMLVLLGMLLPGDKDPEQEAKDKAYKLMIDICIASQIEVTKYLKSPSTADFPTCKHGVFSSGDIGEYIYSSYVDAQNAFGAMLRNSYTCKVTSWNGVNEKYRISCEIDE